MELAEKDYFLNGTYSEKVRDRIIEAFEDFVYSGGCNEAIYDEFSKRADENVPVYYDELTNAVNDLREACESVIFEGLFVVDPKTFSLDRLLSSAYWYVINSEFDNCREEIIFNFCVATLRDENVKEISEEEFESLEDFASNYDTNNTTKQLEKDVLKMWEDLKAEQSA